MDDKKNLLLLFDRPQEPCFMSKGTGQVLQVFDVPNALLPEKYKPLGLVLANRFGATAEKIPVKDIQPPNLGEILDLDRNANFSLFIPKHRIIAGKLTKLFLDAPSIADLTAIAIYARDRVNPYLFNYSLSVALLHKPETRNLNLPSIVHSFPDKFFDGKLFNRARENATVLADEKVPIEIPRDYTASDLEEEHRVAYWREDIGLNIHHWHWHLVYPYEGDLAIVKKNRRGELFYYMHQQILARYNCERLANGLKRVTRYGSSWQDPVAEAYFPKLDSLVSSRTWAGRPPNLVPKDVIREADQIKINLDNMNRWRDRIYDAIHSGSYTDANNQKVSLTENEGIDVLGDIMEASILSPNRNFYGDYHNMGHVILGYIHDPDHRHLEQFGVMADAAVDLRDPIFFRWHAYIDDMFQDFKATLPRYTETQLGNANITVTEISVQSQGSRPNALNTFWQQSDLELSRGIDFQPRGSVLVRFSHLQHQPFTYTINVNNTGSAKRGTCRIFMAPKFDERGNPWLFRNQKDMFMEMDRFTVNLKPGSNPITRKSTESSVTIPFEQTFRDLDLNRPTGGTALDDFNFCGCGWPQHMLLPRGTAEGYPMHLFVMISNYDDDRVEQDITGTCNDGDVYCGIKGKLYPDRRSMGFPFDRQPRNGVNTLAEFLTPNMRVQDFVIVYNNRVVRPKTGT